MFRALIQFDCMTSFIGSRLCLSMAAAVLALVFFGQSSAEAGVVTSMQAGGMAAPEVPVPNQRPAAPWGSFPQISGQIVGLCVALDTSSQSTTSTPTSSFSSTHPPAAIASACELPSPASRGWVVPESTLALPPLLPSGLFRPPCASL
jgi:hypothetical protein